MAIPAKQIGQPSSTKAALLWNISKQLEILTQTAGSVIITPSITGGWSVVTGGEAGDGTVAQYSDTGFNITGPDDGTDNGWVYIKKYYPNGASLSVDYQWASVDDGLSTDRPFYCLDETEPTGVPSDDSAKVENTPETGTWNIDVPAGQWLSIGIYSSDSCCGRGFLSVDVIENAEADWVFTPNEISVFPSNSDGYTLYEGGFTSNDDGNALQNVPFAGTFYVNSISDTEYNLSTNGYIIPSNSGANLKGNAQDLFITPGDPLSDGDTQNFWYQNYTGATRWRTNILVYCGHCCGDPNQSTPYSYVLNVYRDSQYQYVEACNKQNNEVAGDAGVDENLETSSSATQVWQSDLNGNNWTYLGFGSIADGGPVPTTTTTTTTAVPTPFLMTVNIANPGTTVTLPYGASATYTGTIDWGDATVTANSFATKQHTYAAAGTYQITIDGTVGFWNAGYYSAPINQLVSIDQFGNQFSFGSNEGTYFAGLSGLLTVASDIPLTGITSMYAMFSSCSRFNQDISGWDVSAITEMTGMFANASDFNQDLSNWCVTSIPTEPGNFANGATSWVLPKPVWGTCP